MNKKPKIIIITGPCGVGKTTIAKIISKNIDVKVVNGDKIRKSIFPNIIYITKHPEKLQFVKEKIFELSKQQFFKKQSILIDYVILGEEYIKRFKNEFKEHLVIKVILPSKEVIYERDKKRSCWTSGQKMIDELYQKYLDLVNVIGKENYINNGKETPEETARSILNCII